MMRLWTLLLVSLLVVLEVQSVACRHHGGLTPGSPHNVSLNDHSLQSIVLTAVNAFNNQSNDAFLFKPSAIPKAQDQIVKGIRYIIDMEISRTICRKQGKKQDLSNCDFQPAGRLQQMFHCHLDVWVIPWKHQTKTLIFSCKP